MTDLVTAFCRLVGAFAEALVKMARLAGFEPATAWFVARYSIQLSYKRAVHQLSVLPCVAGESPVLEGAYSMHFDYLSQGVSLKFLPLICHINFAKLVVVSIWPRSRAVVAIYECVGLIIPSVILLAAGRVAVAQISTY